MSDLLQTRTEWSMSDLMEITLPESKPDYLQKLSKKHCTEEIVSSADVLLQSQKNLNKMLREHPEFNYKERADILSLRDAIDPNRKEKDQSSHSWSNNNNGGGRKDSRSRSPHKWPDERRGSTSKKSDLWSAVEGGDEETVKRLLDDGKIDQKFQGLTLLMKASEEGCVNIMHMLSFAAAPCNHFKGRSPTPRAALIFLLKSKADADRKCNRRKTPKEYAKEEGRTDTLKIFEDYRK